MGSNSKKKLFARGSDRNLDHTDGLQSAARKRRDRRGALVALLLLGAGSAASCSSSYVYQPTEQVTATVQGQPAARYAIPPERPEGVLRIASFGVRDLEMAGGENKGKRIRVLVVRVEVENDGSDTPFRIDSRNQLVALPGEGSSRAAYVNGSDQQAPVVSVGRGQKQTLDFYFPLPESLQKASKLPAFDFLWQVDTDIRVVSGRTPFERLEIEPVSPSYGVGLSAGFGGPYWSLGFGPYWWYDPFWGDYTFYHPPYWHYPPYGPIRVYPAYRYHYVSPTYRHPAPPPPPPAAHPQPLPPRPQAAPPAHPPPPPRPPPAAPHAQPAPPRTAPPPPPPPARAVPPPAHPSPAPPPAHPSPAPRAAPPAAHPPPAPPPAHGQPSAPAHPQPSPPSPPPPHR